MEKHARFCTDRVLPSEQMRFQSTVRRNGSTLAVMPICKVWMNGSTLRVRFLGGTGAQQAKAREQALWWTQFANLNFDFNNAPDAEIRIAFDPADGAWSYIGTDNRSIPPLSQPTMNLGFMDGGTAEHEFGRAIGLAHEHQNPAGGIEGNEAVVLQSLKGPPSNWDEATIRHNVLNKHLVNQVRGTAFDPDSIMLYFFPGSWASAQAYPKAGPTVQDAVGLKVGAARRTAARIGEAGEEGLFRFEVATGGNHVMDAKGPTDVVMRLYGPGSHTNVVAEDDDSGLGTNARITASLVPGLYYAQVRPYNRATGKGDFTVRVRRG